MTFLGSQQNTASASNGTHQASSQQAGPPNQAAAERNCSATYFWPGAQCPHSSECVHHLCKEGTLQTKSFVGFLSFVRLYVGAGGITSFHMQTCHIMLGLMMGFHVYQVEHIFREENILAAYDILELFCELITVRLPIIESQKYVVTLRTFIPESRR